MGAGDCTCSSPQAERTGQQWRCPNCQMLCEVEGQPELNNARWVERGTPYRLDR